MLADSVSGVSPLPGSQTANFLLCPHLAEGVRELSGVSFLRPLIPFMKAPPSWPNHLTKAPPPNTITLVVRFQQIHLEVYKYSVYSIRFFISN